MIHRGLSKLRFNLVIEVLLISSTIRIVSAFINRVAFQSRNRGSFDFKPSEFWTQMADYPFQSRNRGSFDFKTVLSRFEPPAGTEFQSRNRGSFDFKYRRNRENALFIDKVSIS